MIRKSVRNSAYFAGFSFAVPGLGRGERGERSKKKHINGTENCLIKAASGPLVNYLNDFLPLRSCFAKTPLYQPSTNDPVSIRHSEFLFRFFTQTQKVESSGRCLSRRKIAKTKDGGEGVEGGRRRNARANCAERCSAIEQRHRNVVKISQSVITFPSCSADR